jgi:glycosyltransferase involved in cell wall biosynthesis
MRKGSCRYDVAIVSHIFATGPAHALEEYFRRKRRAYLFIGHPFLKRATEPSFCIRWCTDGPATRIQSRLPLVPEPYRYFFDLLITLWWIMRFGPVDVLIGCGNLNAFAGIILRKVGLVRRVIFYAIDYVPYRFDQRLLNVIYHWIECICATKSDCVWNLSPAMVDARAQAGIAPAHAAPQLIVPMGSGFDISQRVMPKKDPATIAFVGHLLEKHGVQIALQALPEVLRVVPDARMLVMGTGPYENELKCLARRLGVADYVEFTGFIEDFSVIQRRLAQSTVGIALYLDNLDRWTKYADPGKIKDYLAAALPIITTAVPPAAQRLAMIGAGVIVDPVPTSVATELIRLLTNRTTLARMSQLALLAAKEYDWDNIFTNAFQASMESFADEQN